MRPDATRKRETTVEAIIAKLVAVGLKPRVKTFADGGSRITVHGVANDSHPKQESVDIDVDSTGKVTRSSKYAYLLPESVGDDVRLA